MTHAPTRSAGTASAVAGDGAAPLETRSARTALSFACVGHAVAHLYAPIFFVVALSLEREFQLTHGQAVALVVSGTVLYGVAAPLAGWLGDRWSATGMLAVFFLGTGWSMVATGLASGPLWIAVALATTGLFGSIYHPVGMAWLIRNTRSWGWALGINGVFGALGSASAALSAGVLIDFAGWRAAFIVPGLMVLATGILFCLLRTTGRLADSADDRRPIPRAPAADARRAIVVLSATMVCTGLIYQATQACLPKLLAERAAGLFDQGLLGLSATVALVSLAAGGVQVLGGLLCDRFPMKLVYVLCFALQVPVLVLASGAAGAPLLGIVLVMVAFNVGGLPAENALVARYARADRRGLAFGLKFVLAFGISGLGVWGEGILYDATHGFVHLFALMATVAGLGALAGLLLPTERRPSAGSAADGVVETVLRAEYSRRDDRPARDRNPAAQLAASASAPHGRVPGAPVAQPDRATAF